MAVFGVHRALECSVEDGTMTRLRRLPIVCVLSVLTAPCSGLEPPAKSSDHDADRAAIVAGIKRLGGWVKPDDPKAAQPVVEVHLSNSRVTDADMAPLAGLTELRSLELMATNVSDAGLAQLKPLVNLEELNITSHRITDGGISGLAELRNLRRLMLRGCALTGEGLAHLQTLGRLQQLDLGQSRASDAGLASLEKATGLRGLILDDTDVSDAGLAHLQGLTGLQSLVLSGTRVSDDGLKHLKGMVDLRILGLNKTAVTGSGLRQLAVLSRLEELYFFEAGITDAGLAELKPFKNLKRLSLWGSSIGDAGLAHLARLVRLERLELNRTQITDAGLVHLEGLADLYYLDMNETGVTPEAAARLQRSLADTQIVDGSGQTVGNKVPYNGLGVSDITRQKQAPWIERALPKLAALLAGSEDARRKVAGPLAAEGKPTLLVDRNPSDPAYHERLKRDLAGWSEAAVRRSLRYDKPVHPTGSSVTFMPASGIVVAEFIFPPVTVSPTREKGDLTIGYWICPDRNSALGLFWLRSGQISAVGYGRHSEVERAVAASTPLGAGGHDGRFGLPKGADSIGESAYWLDPNIATQLPSRSADEAAEANRYSFLRGNVVVEVATPDVRAHAKRRQADLDVQLDRPERRGIPGDRAGDRSKPRGTASDVERAGGQVDRGKERPGPGQDRGRFSTHSVNS